MPIKQLEGKTTRSSLPRLGKLHKGAPKGTGPGRELPYFRFVSQDPIIQGEFNRIYGMEPTEILCFLPRPVPMENMDYWCEVYSAGGLLDRSDGEISILRREKRGGKDVMVNTPKAIDLSIYPDGDPMKAKVGRLQVVLARFDEAANRYTPAFGDLGYAGVVTLETHGFWDIDQWLGQLEGRACTYIQDEEGNLIAPIPFVLKRVKQNISVPGFGPTAGKRTRADKVMAFLYPAKSYVADQYQLVWGGTDGALLDAGAAPKMAPALPAGPTWTTGATVPAAGVKKPSIPANPLAATDADFDDVKGPEDGLGELLWPMGTWETDVKSKVMSKDNAAEFLTTRMTDLTGPLWTEKICAHVKRGWPNIDAAFSAWVARYTEENPGLLPPTAEHVATYLAAAATASQALAARPERSVDELVSMIGGYVAAEMAA